MAEERNDGLHPRHPGRGKCAVIELESDEGDPEVGGFLIFLPSGATKIVHWRQAKPIQPTLEGAKDYAAKIAESLLKQHGDNTRHVDIAGVNWTSITAAIQRVILDWNHKVMDRINAKMVRDIASGKVVGGKVQRTIH